MLKDVSLITGVAGFVAGHLTEHLLAKGEVVVGTKRWYEEMDEELNPALEGDFLMETLDLTDAPSCNRIIQKYKPDYIYHLAAQSYVQESFLTPSSTLLTNGVGTIHLLEAIRLTMDMDASYSPTVLICSSSEVYGQVRQSDVPINESTPFNPVSPYAVSKVTEDMLGYQYWKNYGIKCIRTRMFTHTGPRRKMLSAENAFAAQIVRIEAGLQKPTLYVGNLDSIRTYSDVRDAVVAYRMCTRLCEAGEAYNIGGNTIISIKEVLDRLLDLSNLSQPPTIKVAPALIRPTDVTLQIPDISKFQNACPSWHAAIPLEKTLSDILDWHRGRLAC